MLRATLESSLDLKSSNALNSVFLVPEPAGHLGKREEEMKVLTCSEMEGEKSCKGISSGNYKHLELMARVRQWVERKGVGRHRESFLNLNTILANQFKNSWRASDGGPDAASEWVNGKNQNKKEKRPYSKGKESEKFWKFTKEVKGCLKNTEKETGNSGKLVKYIFSHTAPWLSQANQKWSPVISQERCWRICPQGKSTVLCDILFVVWQINFAWSQRAELATS